MPHNYTSRLIITVPHYCPTQSSQNWHIYCILGRAFLFPLDISPCFYSLLISVPASIPCCYQSLLLFPVVISPCFYFLLPSVPASIPCWYQSLLLFPVVISLCFYFLLPSLPASIPCWYKFLLLYPVVISPCFYSLLLSVPVLCHQPSWHKCFLLAIVFKFVAANILLQRCKQMIITRRRIPLTQPQSL